MKLTLEGNCSDIKSILFSSNIEHVKQENEQQSLINVHNEFNKDVNVDKIPEPFFALRSKIIKTKRDRKEQAIGLFLSDSNDMCIVLATSYNDLWIYISTLKAPDEVSEFRIDLKYLKEKE